MPLLSDLVAIGTGHSMISVSDSGLEKRYLDLTQGQEIFNFTREIADIFLQVHSNSVLLVIDLIKDLLDELVWNEVLREVWLSFSASHT